MRGDDGGKSTPMDNVRRQQGIPDVAKQNPGEPFSPRNPARSIRAVLSAQIAKSGSDMKSDYLPGPTQRPVLPGQYSTFIYGWRLLATAAVFLGHATRPDILFDVDFSLIGRATIPTFLIISGYFTAMSFSSAGGFSSKVGNRYYQLYVFFVPATLLVFVMDLYMLRVGSPFLLSDKIDPDMTASRILLDVFNLFTFSGEYWSLTTKGQGVFSNMAIWTIDYIMAYVVMTGALYLLRGKARILVLLAACLIAGPTVILLAPLWFTGVLAYEVHRWFGSPEAQQARRLGLSPRSLKWVALNSLRCTWITPTH